MRNALSSVLPMLLVLFAIPSPAGAEMTVYIAGQPVEVPVSLQLVMLGFALLGVGGLIRKWRQKSPRRIRSGIEPDP